jgi:hypothetical protein
MNERIAKIEAQIGTLISDVKSIKSSLWPLALTIMVPIVFTVIGTGIAIQQMTVSTFRAAADTMAQPAAAPQQPIIINVPSAPAATTAAPPANPQSRDGERSVER